jgi:hypothetical protein
MRPSIASVVTRAATRANFLTLAVPPAASVRKLGPEPTRSAFATPALASVRKLGIAPAYPRADATPEAPQRKRLGNCLMIPPEIMSAITRM